MSRRLLVLTLGVVILGMGATAVVAVNARVGADSMCPPGDDDLPGQLANNALLDRHPSGASGADRGAECGDGSGAYPDKCTIHMKAGDVLRMLTPGGGGWARQSLDRGSLPVVVIDLGA